MMPSTFFFFGIRIFNSDFSREFRCEGSLNLYEVAVCSSDVYDIVDFSATETMSDYFVFGNYRE